MKLHIWTIPRVTIVLEENYKNELSNKIMVLFGNFNKLATTINICNASIHQAFRKNRFPIYLLEKILVATKSSKKICKKKITKALITQLLNEPKTSKELARIIGIQIQNIRKHLKNLELQGFIKVHEYSKYNVPVWTRVKNFKSLVDGYKEQILEALSNKSNISTRTLSTLIRLSKEETLRYLHLLEKENKIKHLAKGRTFLWSLNESRRIN